LERKYVVCGKKNDGASSGVEFAAAMFLPVQREGVVSVVEEISFIGIRMYSARVGERAKGPTPSNDERKRLLRHGLPPAHK